MTDHVRLELDEAVAIVTLDNPPLNIFDLEMRDGLIGAFTAIRDIPDVRAMVLRAAGTHFSAGADLSEFGTAESIMEARRIRWDRDPWGPLWELRVPTIAALHGFAVGSGMEMAMLCDLRLAAPDTKLGLPETKLGMLPAAGGTQSLARAIGATQSLPIVATAMTMDADEAQQRGIVHQVVASVDSEALGLARQLSTLDPVPVANTKRLLRAAGDLPLTQGLALEWRLAQQTQQAGQWQTSQSQRAEQ